ncbi:MAG TPA: hypothetical protein VFE91_04280 [Nitrososphaerales archaeon]|nr:hypothetical protein [Nitrososphaerales archaeon]
MCVGHEPYLTALAPEIAVRGIEDTAVLRMSLEKGGLIRLEVNPKDSGQIQRLLTPKLVRKMI